MEVVIEQNSKGVVEDGVVISQVNQIKFYMLSSHLPLNIILKTKWWFSLYLPREIFLQATATFYAIQSSFMH